MPGTPEPSRTRTLIALDFGQRRIGLAVGQRITDSASPLGTAGNGPNGPDWQAIGRWIDEWQPDRLIVGMPYNVDGSRSTLAEQVEAFIAALSRYQLPVQTVDERYSSLEAEANLREARARGSRGTVRKESVDAAAAVLIAERWMREQSENDVTRK
jgi:putative Holliday junction resolvase